MSATPEIDWDKVRHAGDHVMPNPFPDHDVNGCPGEGQRLDHFARWSRVVDRDGNRFLLMGCGSVQGSVILRDRYGRMFHADCSQHLKLV